MLLNARWSEAEKCCVEYLVCEGCRTICAGDGDTGTGSDIIGAHVIHCADSRSDCKYRAGQVRLVDWVVVYIPFQNIMYMQYWDTLYLTVSIGWNNMRVECHF